MKGKLDALKDYGYYVDEKEGKIYFLEGTDHLKTLLFDSNIFSDIPSKDAYQVVIVDISKLSGDVIDAYISKKDYRTVVYPLFRGTSFKMVYRKLKTSKTYDKSKSDLKLGGVRCSVGIDKENRKDAKVLTEDILDVMSEYISIANDSNIMYDLRVGTVLINTVFGGNDLASNIHKLLFRYFSAMCVEGDIVKVSLYCNCKM